MLIVILIIIKGSARGGSVVTGRTIDSEHAEVEFESHRYRLNAYSYVISSHSKSNNAALDNGQDMVRILNYIAS